MCPATMKSFVTLTTGSFKPLARWVKKRVSLSPGTKSGGIPDGWDEIAVLVDSGFINASIKGLEVASV